METEREKAQEVYNEIDIWELEENIGEEICIKLFNGERYFGVLRDIDDEELILSRPNITVSLGFKLGWIHSAYVKEN